MPRAMHPCASCGQPVRGRCTACRQRTDQRRGTSHQRGYDKQHRLRFRAAVLARDPVCVCTNTDHSHGPRCTSPAVHADHYPLDRRELVARGMDPNDPRHGRGLCHPCHSAETARYQPGGWNRPT